MPATRAVRDAAGETHFSQAGPWAGGGGGGGEGVVGGCGEGWKRGR